MRGITDRPMILPLHARRRAGSQLAAAPSLLAKSWPRRIFAGYRQIWMALSESWRPPIDLQGANLRGADFTSCDLSLVDFRGADLSEARLDRTTFAYASLQNVIARKASLTKANLSLVDCDDADFSGSDLSNAHFSAVSCWRASLVAANLGNTIFETCRMDDADLLGATCGFAVWANTDLRGIRNLADVRHVGPSTVGLDTVLASRGDIPEVFLRGLRSAGHAHRVRQQHRSKSESYPAVFLLHQLLKQRSGIQ